MPLSPLSPLGPAMGVLVLMYTVLAPAFIIFVEVEFVLDILLTLLYRSCIDALAISS